METKTNVMRTLDKMQIEYISHCYAHTGVISGVDVATVLNKNPKQVFKTLVTAGNSKKYYVFVIPVSEELNLKKAAQSLQEKSIEMIKAKELLPLSGYVHGGCSPIGMKKMFITTIDASAAAVATILFSAGKIGFQVEMSLAELKKVLNYTLADVV
jgi:Cys-tRNA(Pro)/Cys-tRNA(Cys) deacylase